MPRAAPKDPCPVTGGRHRYGNESHCQRCGKDKPIANATGTRERRPARATSNVSKTQYKQSIALAISGSQNLFFAFIAPELAEDALQHDEIAMLADALTDEITASPRLVKFISDIRDKGGKHSKLIITLLLIALPRLARRGVIPGGVDDLVKAALAVATGPAPNSDRGDGERQVNVDESGTGTAYVPDSYADETGRRDVSDSDSFSEGGDDLEFEIQPNRVASQV